MDKFQILIPDHYSCKDTRFSLETPSKKDKFVDIGFCERMFFWSLTQYFVEKIIPNSEVLVRKFTCPQLKFLNLPKTKILNEDYKNFKPISLNSFGSLLSSDYEKLKHEQYFQTFVNNIEKYYFDFSMREINLSHFDFSELENKILLTTIREIKFKKQSANNFFEKHFKNVVGIHLRRGSGVLLSNEYLEECLRFLSKNEFDEYYNRPEYKKMKPPPGYVVIPNSKYFEIIDKILNKNRNIKIYISCDVPLNFLIPFFERYPNNILTKNDYINEFFSLFSEELSDNYEYVYSLNQCLTELLDLFAISNSKVLIGNPFSRWSNFANVYKKKFFIDATSI